MNAAARALAQSPGVSGSIRLFVLSKEYCRLICLIMMVLVSAVAVVYVKDLNRRLFSELETLQQARDELRIESGQLLLEQNTWATQARIQQIAQQQLSMN